MSTATLTPAAGGFNDPALAAFLAQVPAARDYDLDAMTDGMPRYERRPARSNARRAAINESLREWR
jgi:hypothetical protein